MSGTQAIPRPVPPPIIGVGPPPHVPEKSGETVTVACKIPSGIQMRLFKMEERIETVFGGGQHTIMMAMPVGKAVIIAGNAFPANAAPVQQIIGGYALTHGVDAALAREWMHQNADSDIVRNRLIYIEETPDRAAGKGREQAELRSGMEPLDPNHLPRGMERISTGERKP